jgi:hypothetical protein
MAGLIEGMLRRKEGMGIRDRNAYKEAVGASIDASEPTAEPERVPGYQGVTAGPKGPGSSKAGFIAEQIRKGKDEATARRMADQIFGR